MSDEQQRLREANRILKMLAEHGPVFYSEAHDRLARFGFDSYGTLRYMDDQSGMLMYPFYPDRVEWRGFTRGVQAKLFIGRLAEYIRDDRAFDLACFPVDAATAQLALDKAQVAMKATAPC